MTRHKQFWKWLSEVPAIPEEEAAESELDYARVFGKGRFAVTGDGSIRVYWRKRKANEWDYGDYMWEQLGEYLTDLDGQPIYDPERHRPERDELINRRLGRLRMLKTLAE